MKSPETGENALNEKLFLPWNLEGEANMEYLEFLREVNEELLKREDYVGISGFGSQFKGYNTQGSDFDLIIIGGDGSYVTATEYSKVISAILQKYNQKHTSIPYIADKKTIVNDLNINESRSHRASVYGECLWLLSYPLVGRKEVIEELRVLAREKHKEIQKNNEEFSLNLFRKAIESIISKELGVNIGLNEDLSVRYYSPSEYTGTVKKIKSRGVEEDELKGIVENRIKLWTQRIQNMLEEKEEFEKQREFNF